MNKAKKTKKPGLTEAEKREQVKLALLKKREYEDRALEIVHRLIDEGVDGQWLIQSGKSLNESYWDDAVTERSITLVCGYPLCDEKITIKHKGKYKVSLRDNKVYEMEERNKFCSNFCFKASYFFRDQLDSSPLWLREAEKKTFVLLEKESPIPEKILISEKVVVSGEGIIVDFSGSPEIEVKCDINGNDAENLFGSDSENDELQTETVESTVESLMEAMIIKDFGETNKRKAEDEDEKSKPESDQNHSTVGASMPQWDDIIMSDEKGDKKSEQDIVDMKMEDLCLEDKDIPKKEKVVLFKEEDIPKKDKVMFPKKKRARVQTNTANPVDVVKAAIKDWFSIDTYRCVVGDEYLRNTLVEKGVSEENIVKTVGDPFLKQDMQAKYRALCRKIDLAEVMEDTIAEELDDISMVKQPMPNYEDLKKEVTTDLLKVSSYFKGKEMYNEDISKKKDIIDKENDDDYDEPRLPLVDKFAEVALRRRIVLDKLDRSLPDVLDLLDFPLSKVRSKMKELVHSFYLTQDNVMFRPQEWSLISLLIVKLLSVNNEELKSAFKKPSSQKFLNMLLLSYQLPESFLEETVISLTGNIDVLLAKMANNTAAIFTA